MGRSVVVTGANSGIGLATAVELAAHGYDVVGTVRSDEKGAVLEEAAAARDAKVRYVTCDVADAASVEAAFAEFPPDLYGLVNNAGYALAGPVEEVGDDDARDLLETNVLGPMRLCRLVLPGMRERGEGRIVNVSSVAGRIVTPMTGWYCATKHALEALSDALRQEVGGFGVKVVLVEPGSFGTGIWGGANDRMGAVPDGPYAAAYERARAVSDKSGFMPDPVWVARTIRLALGSRYPLPRYLVGVDAVVGTALDKVAPTFVGDYVKAASLGLRRLPFIG